MIFALVVSCPGRRVMRALHGGWSVVASGCIALLIAPSIARVEPLARVHVNAPRPAFLHRRPAGTTDFVLACEAPCDVDVPRPRGRSCTRFASDRSAPI